LAASAVTAQPSPHRVRVAARHRDEQVRAMPLDVLDGRLGRPHPRRGNRAVDVSRRIRCRHVGKRQKLVAHVEAEHAAVAAVDARNGLPRDPRLGRLREERIDGKRIAFQEQGTDDWLAGARVGLGRGGLLFLEPTEHGASSKCLMFRTSLYRLIEARSRSCSVG
jgi:hypothetical protein